VDATGTGAPQKPRALQHLDVLGDGLERHVEGRGKLGHRVLFCGNSPENRASNGVGQRVKDVVEVVGS
jgi:hypothetical protein